METPKPEVLADFPWEKISEILLRCGSTRDERELCLEMAHDLREVVPYDSSRVYFVGPSGEVDEMAGMGLDDHWVESYLDYYSKIKDGQYAVRLPPSKDRKTISNITDNTFTMDWTEGTEHQEFVRQYIRPQHIPYGMGTWVRGPNNEVVATITFDRESHGMFNERERKILSLVSYHVNNMCAMLLTTPPPRTKEGNLSDLTNREREISYMLYRGMKPSAIAECLLISRSTVYVHIDHIHKKLGVKNSQELMIALASLFG